jgi:hypothetical protein
MMIVIVTPGNRSGPSRRSISGAISRNASFAPVLVTVRWISPRVEVDQAGQFPDEPAQIED